MTDIMWNGNADDIINSIPPPSISDRRYQDLQIIRDLGTEQIDEDMNVEWIDAIIAEMDSNDDDNQEDNQ